MAKPDPKPVPKPDLPDCWFGSDPAATEHTFTVFVQDDPPLVVTYCTRCGQIAVEKR